MTDHVQLQWVVQDLMKLMTTHTTGSYGPSIVWAATDCFW